MRRRHYQPWPPAPPTSRFGRRRIPHFTPDTYPYPPHPGRSAAELAALGAARGTAAAAVGTAAAVMYVVPRTYARRRVLAPLLVGIAAHGGGIALRWWPQYAWTVDVAWLAVATVMAWRAWDRKRRRLRWQLWRAIYAGVATVALWAYFPLAAAVGAVHFTLHQQLLWWSVGAVVVLQTWWWWFYRAREVEEDAPDEPDVPREQWLWNEYVAPPGKLLPGARLTGLRDITADNRGQ